MQSPMEYRYLTSDDMSVRTVLAEKGRCALVHGTAGYECAGSMARYTKEYWAAETYLDGTRHGVRKLTEAEAREVYEKRLAHDAKMAEIKKGLL